MIKRENGNVLYFDKNGEPIVAGSSIRYSDGRICKVYLTSDGLLGIDATNPDWIKQGRANECEFGIYPLSNSETEEVEVIN